MTQSSFVIAGTDSGCGKTTVTLAVLAALSERGINVQAFKAGPDYIDSTYHNLIAPNQKSRNLDLWLCTQEQVKHFYARAMSRAEVGVVEGVMGLFDGKFDKSVETSTAAIAKTLNLPVILVINASKMAQSIGAVVHGFLEYDKKVKVVGVILNHVNGEEYYQILKDIIESKYPVKCFGYLPFDKELHIPERHLGLIPSQENNFNVERLIEAGKTIDFDKLLTHPALFFASSKLRRSGEELRVGPSLEGNLKSPLVRGVAPKATGCVRLGIARDEAFHFYYEDALDELIQAGFELVAFSPLNDQKLPADLDALYFGGGFPEVFEKQLAANAPMTQSVREWMQDKKPVLAECGGLMYLVSSGVIPGNIRMTNRLQNFGYKEIRPLQDNFLFTSDEGVRIHEFHYSVWDRPESETQFAFEVNGKPDGFWNGHILASYYHSHLGAYPKAIKRFYESAKRKAHV